MQLFPRYRKSYEQYMEKFNLEALKEKCRNNPLILDKHKI